MGDLWVEMCEAENDWLSCQHGPRRCLLKSVYVQKRKRFDKNKTKQKRKFWKSDQDGLINEAETDPNKFWKSIGKIGIKQDRKPVIPMEVYDNHGNIIIRQRGTKVHVGDNVGIGTDHTIYALVDGHVEFKPKDKKRNKVSVIPA